MKSDLHACLGSVAICISVAACGGAPGQSGSGAPGFENDASPVRDAEIGRDLRASGDVASLVGVADAAMGVDAKAGDAAVEHRDDGGVMDRDSGEPRDGSPGDAQPPGAGAAPIKLFLDTDLVIDPGDMGAVAMAHGLADRCEVEIIGMTVVSTDNGAAGALDAVNRYYGRPNIPIGVLKGGTFLGGSPYASRVMNEYPNAYKGGAGTAPDATAVFRKVIAAQPDGSVAVVAIGPQRNLRHFVDSGPDAASPLGGRELIAKKVRLLSVMGGHFESPSFHEWNIEQDVEAAKTVVAKWPGEMVWGGFEAGVGFQPDIGIIAKRPKSPVTFALTNAGGNSGARPGWDQTSLLYAARPKSPYWQLSAGGRIGVNDDAGTTWQAQANGAERFIKNVDGDKTPASELVGVTLTKYGKLSAVMDDLEASAGHIGDCRPAASQASKE